MRGGLVYLEWLARAHLEVRGVITATRGEPRSVGGFAAGRQGRRAVVIVPLGNSPEKKAAMRALGVDLIE